MNRLLIFIAALSCAAACPALGEQYWIAYEGNDFPENEGWTREYGAGGAERWIEDGALVLDSLDDILIYDFYAISRSVDPEPAELFVMRWRLLVDEVTPREDPGVAVFSDDSWGVGFLFGESYVESAYEDGLMAPFEPGASHLFEFRSWDMRGYELRIDGQAALAGEFYDTFSASQVAWGDGGQGSYSMARWDYFRFGVVPEPRSVSLFALGLLAGRRLS